MAVMMRCERKRHPSWNPHATDPATFDCPTCQRERIFWKKVQAHGEGAVFTKRQWVCFLTWITKPLFGVKPSFFRRHFDLLSTVILGAIAAYAIRNCFFR